ncbi:MAG: hypothetical protein IKB71_06700 [Lentisphaeria bacterium]|nr:hypothetical protein [Lentisphaeria bacterium]
MTQKAFTFYNIVPCNPGNEELAAQDVIELEKLSGIDIALYTLTLHPEGFPANKKADFLIDSYRKFSKALQGSKVRPGVLIQSILGHWPRVDKNEEQWTRTVDLEGRTPRFCPWDENFKAYIFRTVSLLAKENPCFIMGDDDIRFFSPYAECFCEKHTAEFNRRTGNNFTPEEYRLAVKNCKVDDEIFTAFNTIRIETVNGVCKLIREAIDSVNPDIPAATCMPGWELRYNGFAAQAIAGKNQQPIMRIANGSYAENTPYLFPDNYLRTQSLREFWANIPNLLDETDTCPHTLYSKSAISIHSKLCSAAFAGLNGSKLWYVNCHKALSPVNRKYTEIISKYNGTYQELTATVKNSASCGIIIPQHDQFPNWHPSNTMEWPMPTEHWANNFLGWYGIPFRGTYDFSQDGIYAIEGKSSVARFTDEQLKQILSHKVLLDGAATVALTERGFAEYLGVSAENKEFLFNREISADGNSKYPLSKHPDIPFMTLLDNKAEVLTELGYSSFAYAQEIEKVAPASVLYRNSLGGTVCSTVFARQMLWSPLYDGRKDWLNFILEKLNGGNLPFCATEYQPIMLLNRKLQDGSDLLGLFNLGFDALHEVSIKCAAPVQKVEILLASGIWQEVKFKYENNTLVFAADVECYSNVIFKVR